MSEKRLLSLAFAAAAAVAWNPAQANVPMAMLETGRFRKVAEGLKKAVGDVRPEFPGGWDTVGSLPKVAEGIKKSVGDVRPEFPGGWDTVGSLPKVAEGIKKSVGDVRPEFPGGWDTVASRLPTSEARKKLENLPLGKLDDFMLDKPDLSLGGKLGDIPLGDKLGDIPLGDKLGDIPLGDKLGDIPLGDKLIDWRNHLPDDFDWGKFIPLDFDWKSNLPAKFPDWSEDALDWEKFSAIGLDWDELHFKMGEALSGRWKELLMEKFPNFDLLSKEDKIQMDGIGWSVFFKDFFSFQRILHTDFDWREHLVKDFDLRDFAKEDISKLLPIDFDWRAHLDKGDDWLGHIPEGFDWKDLLEKQNGHIFPFEMDWKEVIPDKLTEKFAWQPFMESILHWKEISLDLGLSKLPVGDEWLNKWALFDWEKLHDLSDVIPEKFDWINYKGDIAEKFSFLTKFDEIPEPFEKFLGQLHGIKDWANSDGLGNLKGAFLSKPLRIGATLETLKIDPLDFTGKDKELDIAFIKEMAGSWFEKFSH